MYNLIDLANAPEPWVKYNARLHLTNNDLNDPGVIVAKNELLKHPLLLQVVAELKQWPGIVISSHKSAGQLYHKLAFVADLGLTEEELGLSDVLDQVMSQVSEEGLFQLTMNIPTHFGGTGQDDFAWALCDAPVLMYSVIKFRGHTEATKKGVDFLLSTIRDNGWPCQVSKNLGKFRGPGRKGDPCPYVNLIMLKLLTLVEGYEAMPEAKIGVETLLELWTQSKERHPYMFFMGTDFRKLKAPFIWYDILHVVEVLSHFGWVWQDPRFIEMLDLIHSKSGVEGLYTPESEWKAWKGWDFAQKKRPSPWLTFLIKRISLLKPTS